jgi:hypothetical protein
MLFVGIILSLFVVGCSSNRDLFKTTYLDGETIDNYDVGDIIVCTKKLSRGEKSLVLSLDTTSFDFYRKDEYKNALDDFHIQTDGKFYRDTFVVARKIFSGDPKRKIVKLDWANFNKESNHSSYPGYLTYMKVVSENYIGTPVLINLSDEHNYIYNQQRITNGRVGYLIGSNVEYIPLVILNKNEETKSVFLTRPMPYAISEEEKKVMMEINLDAPANEFEQEVPQYATNIKLQNAINKFLNDNYKRTIDLREAYCVLLHYYFDDSGKLSGLRVLVGDNKDLNKSIVEVLQKMPEWKPINKSNMKLNLGHYTKVCLNKK